MAWLLREGEVLATVEVVDSLEGRARLHLQRGELEGAVLLRPARLASTVAAAFPRDVAFCDERLVVLARLRLPPRRLGVPRRGARCVLEAPAGAFDRWSLVPGDQLELKG